MPPLADIVALFQTYQHEVAIGLVVMGLIQIRRAAIDGEEGAAYWAGYMLLAVAVFDFGLGWLLKTMGATGPMLEIWLVLAVLNLLGVLLIIYGIIASIAEFFTPPPRHSKRE